MKQYSWKFWVLFWGVSAVLLAVWYFFLEWQNRGFRALDSLVNVLPVEQGAKDDMQAVTALADYVLQKDGRERVFLVLFQNNTELRPGGGYLGSFGILKIRDGHVTDFAVHDSNIFDGRIPDTVAVPYPMHETLRISSWKFRDSNWSPDFPTNADKAEEFYRMADGQEQFDGVIGITANVLASVLRLTGPVEIPGYPGTYGADNAITDLEYQVEQGWWQQGRELGERKSVMKLLGDQIIVRVKSFGPSKKYELFQTVINDLNQKDIQLSFKDEAVERSVALAHWDGRVDTTWKDDYLLAVDANLAALKSDAVVARRMDYTVDLSGEKPRVTFKMTYKHNGQKKDWKTADYQSFLRVYVPEGSWLETIDGATTAPVFGNDLGHKYFGALVQVPLDTEKTVTLTYLLPSSISTDYYDLKIEKQSGVNDVPVGVHVLRAYGLREDYQLTLNQSWVLRENK